MFALGNVLMAVAPSRPLQGLWDIWVRKSGYLVCSYTETDKALRWGIQLTQFLLAFVPYSFQTASLPCLGIAAVWSRGVQLRMLSLGRQPPQ